MGELYIDGELAGEVLRAEIDGNEILPAPRHGYDQEKWHPWWRRYAAFENRTVVMLTREHAGMWYVCSGRPEYPALWSQYAGDSEEEAQATFDKLVEEMLAA